MENDQNNEASQGGQDATSTDLINANNLIEVNQPFDSKGLIAGILKSVKNGDIEPLKAYTVLKRMQKVAEECFKDDELKKLTLNAFDKYAGEAKGGKSIKLYSAQITKCAVYTTYDYKGCGHEVLDALYQIKEQVDAHIDQLEKEVKAMFNFDDTKNAQIGFGIANDTKDVIFATMPKLTWEGYGLQGVIKKPKKIQKEGLKFMKI